MEVLYRKGPHQSVSIEKDKWANEKGKSFYYLTVQDHADYASITLMEKNLRKIARKLVEALDKMKEV